MRPTRATGLGFPGAPARFSRLSDRPILPYPFPSALANTPRRRSPRAEAFSLSPCPCPLAKYKTHRLPRRVAGSLQIVVPQAPKSVARRGSFGPVACCTTLRFSFRGGWPLSRCCASAFSSKPLCPQMGRPVIIQSARFIRRKTARNLGSSRTLSNSGKFLIQKSCELRRSQA